MSDSVTVNHQHRRFKRLIMGATLLVIVGLFAAFPLARFRIYMKAKEARDAVVRRVVGLLPDRAAIDADWVEKRKRGIVQTRKVLADFYVQPETSDAMRALFKVALMDPDHGLIRYGRGDQAFLISPQVFEIDPHGRSYRMRPNTRSVWLRQITLHKGPFGMFQVLDDDVHRAAAAKAGAIVDEHSVQNTNSWGLRGREPDLNAPVRGIVLGDSFMQAMFNADDETPAVYLERELAAAWKQPASILNTGHIGYSPEQYYYSLKEYGDRFKPQFVVISVCPNDFGDGWAVLTGAGDWWDEAGYWIDEIVVWCRSRSVLCLMVPVPTYTQIENGFHEIYYPAMVRELFHGHPSRYCDPLNEFTDEGLRLSRLARAAGRPSTRSALYNRAIDDDHFSPAGAAFWAKLVGRRLVGLMDPPRAAEGSKP